MTGYIIQLCVVLYALGVNSFEIKPHIDDYDEDREEMDMLNHNSPASLGRVHSKVYQTVNEYYCSLDSRIEGSHLIIFGTKSWTFPMQDVNLTLGYPTAGNASGVHGMGENDLQVEKDLNDYFITGFKVILHIDGKGSKGYITSGGVLQETISLSFVSPKISRLRYQFWLFGARKDTTNNHFELNTHHRLCQ